ncbi:response regulator [Novosphingobium beihaiensis]
MMNGTLSVTSEPGVGSTFSLRLPLFAAQDHAYEDDPGAAVAAGRFEGSPRVLIAEDYDINQLLMKELAESLGMDAAIAANGDEAVRMALDAEARGRPYQLVFMDMQMPDVDGLEATRRLRAAGFDAEKLPIVALTANAYAEDVTACMEAGMQGHLAKPVRASDIRGAVVKWGRAKDSAAKEHSPSALLPLVENGTLKARFEQRKQSVLMALDALQQNPEPEEESVKDAASLLHKLAGTAGFFGEGALGKLAGEYEIQLLATAIEDVARIAGQAARALRECNDRVDREGACA